MTTPPTGRHARDGGVVASAESSRRPIRTSEDHDRRAAPAGTSSSSTYVAATRSAPPPPNYNSPLLQQPRTTHSTAASHSTAGTVVTSNSVAADRLRAPNPAKRVQVNPVFDDLRSAVTRDALREEASKSNQPSVQRNVSAPVLGPAASTSDGVSPPLTPTMTSSSKPSTTIRADPRTIMPRNPSIDSTVSSLDSNNSTSHKAPGANVLKVQQEPSAPEDVAALIAAAGSPEAAIQKVLNDKNQAASHNAQLWRLVEKQRAMILGLNKDLEKSLKEKDRYRKKLKDHLAQSESAPSLTTANQQLEEMVARDTSQSPAIAEDGPVSAAAASMRDMSLDSRKVSDSSELAAFPGRSDTPQDVSIAPSSTMNGIGHGQQPVTRGLESKDNLIAAPAPTFERKIPAPINVQRLPPQILPLASPRIQDLQKTPTTANLGHQKSNSISAASPPPSAASFSSPRSLTSRKGTAPAPLNLASPKRDVAVADITNNVMDASDSEYEDDPVSARAEQSSRGRRKTREEDDQEREEIAKQEQEHRSRSNKSKTSKSKQPAEHPEVPPVEYAPVEPPEYRGTPPPAYQASDDPASIVRQRAIADGMQKSHTAPSLLSPGLPMSPRPGDRPMNSPMPRAPNHMLRGMPMSPKAGMAGLPLSPRAPRQPIPMPPQTPLAFASPHLARAEGYQQHMQSSSLSNQVMSSQNGTPENERPSTSSDPVPMTPGEIYRGYVTEQYPDLLLPPNALPSIYVKTASSRMKPSRQSYIQPKASEENPVFTLAVYSRSDNKQLWRVEKTVVALTQLDEEIRAVWNIRERLPDKALFAGHAPAKIDARRSALDRYFHRMLESVTEEKAAMVVCKFLSTDGIGASEAADYFGGAAGSMTDARPDTPVKNLRPRREGYLTKRGKNFGGWKARYFILDGPAFKYFDTQGGAQLGSIKLQNAQIGKQSNNGQNAQEDEDNQFRHAFLILEPKKKDSSSLVRHVLCAESDEERDAWVDALLQYVDYRESEDEAVAKASHSLRPSQDTTAARSPRFKSSYTDLRPSSRGRAESEPKENALRALGYTDTVAGDAPVMMPGRKGDGTTPPHDANFGPAVDQPASNHPNISAPTNLHVISNDWGMKPPPTPQVKDKKRGLFGFRGRSSSDLDAKDKMMSPGLSPQDHYATGTPRAVFGVPLAEAVEFARPADVATELPAVVYRCIEYLLAKNAIAEEGIFRLSGSNTVIKALKDRFNTEGDVNLLADGTYHDIHAVASLLKLYLRELPASILTRELHLEFLKCLDMHAREKVLALNVIVNQLPRANRALLEALSSLLLSIVNHADINKMNVRNVGIVFAPTLNVPAPLISSFVEDQSAIFGTPVSEAESPIARDGHSASAIPTDLRSPRKQMFSDLPTPAYNQTTFQSFGAMHNGAGNDDTGMIPMHPTYGSYQMAPQGDGGFGSLNDALKSPTLYKTVGNGVPSSRDTKAKRRESGMLGFGTGQGLQKKSSMGKLHEEGASF